MAHLSLAKSQCLIIDKYNGTRARLAFFSQLIFVKLNDQWAGDSIEVVEDSRRFFAGLLDCGRVHSSSSSGRIN